ncbi:MAG: hypothetical protein Q9217_006836 [Psora testacea]
MENRRHSSYPGTYAPRPDNEASYHDPAHVRQWAASSTAGVDPFMDLGSGSNLPSGIPLDFGPMACGLPQSFTSSETQLQSVQMEHSHGLGLDYRCTSPTATGDLGHSMTQGMATFPGQGYEISPVLPEAHFDSGITFQADSLAYPTPLTDDLSFFDAAGTSAMCHQPSSQGMSEYSTEWSRQGSSQGSNGVPMTDVMPGSQPMNLTTSPQFGSSVSSSQSQASHVDTPLSMTMLDDSWSLTNATHGEHVHLPLLGIAENMHLPPTYYPVDQSTLRPHTSTQRPALTEMDTWGQMQNEPTVPGYGPPQYPLPNTSRRTSEGEPTVTARKHPLYQTQPRDDGLYHCPFEDSEACKHSPEKLKCNYDKHLDSHLKPYRCRNPDCTLLKFSSTACLLRHEREAHGLHGHGDKPYPCLFHDCDRSQPGQGFPRQWNLRDHMKRVHGFIVPDTSNGNDYPSPTSSHCSAEANSTVRRKRSPESAQGAASKKAKTGNGLKSSGNVTQPAYQQGGSATSSHQQYMLLKYEMDRTYSNLDPRDVNGFERYKADLARLQNIAEDIRRGEAIQGRY